MFSCIAHTIRYVKYVPYTINRCTYAYFNLALLFADMIVSAFKVYLLIISGNGTTAKFTYRDMI